MSGFVLYGSPHSLPTYRVALMLRLSGAGFAFRYVSFRQKMHLTPEFRALSRWGQVPVLEHDGRVLLQSAAVLEYLAETLGRFGAGDPETRQQVREWLFWDADRLMPPLYNWYSAELGRRGLLLLKFDPVLIAEFDHEGAAALTILDAHLAGRAFIIGETPTIADICCFADIAFARMAGHVLAGWPSVVDWTGRIEALPGYAAPLDLLAMEDADITPPAAQKTAPPP
jgi:glutathione S-transferase